MGPEGRAVLGVPGLKARNVTRGVAIGDDIREAVSFFSRMRGLVGRDRLAAGQGLWISPCTGIHSFGMRFEFDAVFLGADRKVVGLYERFRRNRVSGLFRSARGVLELPAGTIGRTGTQVGDEIRFGQSFD